MSGSEQSLTLTLDIVLFDGETPETVAAMLEQRFGVTVEQVPSGGAWPSFRITGPDSDSIEAVREWRNNDQRPQPGQDEQTPSGA